MDWIRDEEEKGLEIETVYGCSASFRLMAGTFSFSYSPWADSNCSVSCFFPPASSMWNVTLELVAKIKKTVNEPELSECHVFTLCYQDQKKKIKLWTRSDLKPYYCDEDRLTVDISLRVLGSHGLRSLASESSIERCQRSMDGVLMVDGKKISVNKSSLSFDSPFFDALFNANFKEKENGVFELKDVKYDEIVCLLRVLYGCQSVDCEKFSSLLGLSDKYQIMRLKTMCEDYIVEIADVEPSENTEESLAYLHLAEQFTLCRLEDKVVKSIKNMAELKALSADPKFKELSTTAQLFIYDTCVSKF